MGEAAHQRVIERHSIDTEAAKLAALFREAADDSAPDKRRYTQIRSNGKPYP
jgi:hypothetical protein